MVIMDSKITVMTIHSLSGNLEHTKRFVESTKKLQVPYDLLIFDNGSTDGLDWLRKSYKEFIESHNYQIDGVELPNAVKFIYTRSEEDVGLPNAWNWALSYFEQTNHKYALLCDNDLVFTSSINKIFPALDSRPDIGLAAPDLIDRRFELSEIEDYADCEAVDEWQEGLYGPCKVIPRHGFEKIGFFDPQFKYSFDDCDYFERTKKAGLLPMIYKGSYAWHYGGASTSLIKHKLGTPKVDSIYWERFNAKHG